MARYPIVNGPSKLDLMLALFDEPDEKVQRRVWFTITCQCEDYGQFPLETPAFITSVSRVQTDLWQFSGRSEMFDYRTVNGEFSTKSRKGWIDIP